MWPPRVTLKQTLTTLGLDPPGPLGPLSHSVRDLLTTEAPGVEVSSIPPHAPVKHGARISRGQAFWVPEPPRG